MLEKIISYLTDQLELDADSLSAETTFESLDLDSLDIVEMLVELESDAGVELPEEETQGLETIGDLAALIESKL